MCAVTGVATVPRILLQERYRRCCRGRDTGAAAGRSVRVLLRERYSNEERGPLERGAGALLYEEELNPKLVSYHKVCECAGNFH